jgi:hypothetical protein
VAVAFGAAGTGASGSATTIAPSFPAGISAGHLLVCSVLIAAAETMTTPSGWTLMSGPDDFSGARCYLLARIADGSEAGTQTLSFSGSAFKQARIVSFTGNSTVSVDEAIESEGVSSGADSSVEMRSVTTTVADALAAALTHSDSTSAVGNATGESGGDWTEAVAEYQTGIAQIQLQTAAMASPGTISGGSFSIGTGTIWLQYAFAVVPPHGLNALGPEIAFDAATESVRTATTNPYSFNHTGRADASGGIQGAVLVAIHGASSTDHITGVTYGGIAMRRVRTAVDTTTEAGRADIWFLGERLAGLGGTQAVEVTLSSATGDDFEFVAITLTTNDGSEVEVLDSGIVEENVANPSVSLAYSGRYGIAIAGLYGGGAGPTAFVPNGNCVQVASEDLGNFYAYTLRQTTPGISATTFAIGGTAASDDVAYAAAAFGRRQFRNPTPVFQDPAVI